MVIPSLPFHKSGSCQVGLVSASDELSNLGFLPASTDFKPPHGPIYPQYLPGPGPRLRALSSLMNWTPWPQAGGEAETLEV